MTSTVFEYTGPAEGLEFGLKGCRLRPLRALGSTHLVAESTRSGKEYQILLTDIPTKTLAEIRDQLEAEQLAKIREKLDPAEEAGAA